VTLLEGVVALVILGMSAVGFLDVFRAGSAAAHRASQWSRTVQAAESAMEAAALGDLTLARAVTESRADGLSRQVTARPWAAGVSEVVVIVTASGGPSFTLRRLVRESRNAGVRP
jgi:type II secretory pathway pseudopilin PulG